LDKESVIKAHEIIGAQLHDCGLGKLVPEPPFRDDAGDWGPALRGGHHQMGTTRISDDPKTGVIAADGQAHTVRDLYVADSAAFPTGGYANPFLTGLAWSLRVADTVAGRH
jgi:choline dehydrogenase-like flavoprotein